MQSDIHGRWWVWSWPSASRARARCPCPRTWMVAGPARPPTLPKDAAAASPPHLASFPPCGSHCHGFPQSTQPNSSLSHDAAALLHCPVPRCSIHENLLYIFLASVHLGLVLRSASLSVHQWSRMLLFANHHLTLSVGICWNSGTELEPAHGEESRTRRATKCGIERETREPAGAKELSFVGESSNSLFVCWLVPTWKTS